MAQQFFRTWDSLKKVSVHGNDYWSARDIQATRGYDNWATFEGVIQKAQQLCISNGVDPRHHFAEVSKKLVVGSGAMRALRDFALTRYACYLAAMNGDPTKPETATAQAYFASQTRK